MSHLPRTLVALGTAAALTSIAAFAAFAATATGSATATPTATGSAPRCAPAHVSAMMTQIPGSGSAGHIDYRVAIKNRGAASCTLGNHPGLRLLKTNGQRLPTHVTKLGRQRLVTITPGHSASARLHFSPDIPGPLEPVRGLCQPVAHKVTVFLTPTKSVVGPVRPPTPVCEHGAIAEKPLG
jgi:hypothetical protein